MDQTGNPALSPLHSIQSLVASSPPSSPPSYFFSDLQMRGLGPDNFQQWQNVEVWIKEEVEVEELVENSTLP